jgi:hypothetical protein
MVSRYNKLFGSSEKYFKRMKYEVFMAFGVQVTFCYALRDDTQFLTGKKET